MGPFSFAAISGQLNMINVTYDGVDLFSASLQSGAAGTMSTDPDLTAAAQGNVFSRQKP